MNTCTHSHCALVPSARRNRQSGVVLIFALIALTVMLVAAVALIGSFNTSLVAAGNLSFKRDMQNQGERATVEVYDRFVSPTGIFSTRDNRAATKKNEGYSAVVLPTNAQGIPLALMLTDTAFLAAGWTKPDTDLPDQKIKIRYLIDRLCMASTEGTIAQLTEPATCIRAPVVAIPDGGDLWNAINAMMSDPKNLVEGGVPIPAVFRITTRVMGPRNTEAFFQTTFAEPLPVPTPPTPP